jgi:hypothetical protein
MGQHQPTELLLLVPLEVGESTAEQVRTSTTAKHSLPAWWPLRLGRACFVIGSTMGSSEDESSIYHKNYLPELQGMEFGWEKKEKPAALTHTYNPSTQETKTGR